MDLAAVFEVADLFQIKARHEGVGRGPFAGHHDVVARLVPEIIIELHAAQVVLPAPDNLEVLIDVQEAAGRFALGVAEHGDDDVRAQTMNRVRRGEIGLLLDLRTLDHLVQPGVFRIGRAVDDMQIGAAHPRHDQITPLLGGIAMAGRAGVPAHVVQFIADARHFEP